MTKATLLQVLIGVPDDAVIHGFNGEFDESYEPSAVTYQHENKRVILQESPAIDDSTPAEIVLWTSWGGQCCCACDCAAQAARKLRHWEHS